MSANPQDKLPGSTLVVMFMEEWKSGFSRRSNGEPVQVTGKILSVPDIVVAARYGQAISLEQANNSDMRQNIMQSHSFLAEKVNSGSSIYGVSTGVGGSADTRTMQVHSLGHSILQHQHIGILSMGRPRILPVLDPLASTVMPESWVRSAMIVRMNSLVRGHSGVRWKLLEKMGQVVNAHVTPVIPIRGSISASGDLSPLAYVAGALEGDERVHVFDGPNGSIISSDRGLLTHKIQPITFAPKEQLAIMNGTAFSAGVAALAMNDAAQLCLLSQACTAMCTEALLGTTANFDPFIHSVARPHPGQVECAGNIADLLRGSKLARPLMKEGSPYDKKYTLKQDRYALRTAPQFLGPQIEDILSAWTTITLEVNSSTDNPLVDVRNQVILNGGNFQAMSVTNAMEKTRLSLHHIGKIMFAQCTEVINPAVNNGLPPSVAATDPSLNYHAKGIDVAIAAYVSELGHLANPVSTHIQSAEMHNQAVNSLALISARATLASLDVLTMLLASHVYVLCQALDIRSLQNEFFLEMESHTREELISAMSEAHVNEDLVQLICSTMRSTFDKTTYMDANDQMRAMADSTMAHLVSYLSNSDIDLKALLKFADNLATRANALLGQLRSDFLTGTRRSSSTSELLGKTQILYCFVRETLAIPMHGAENLNGFKRGESTRRPTIGQNISIIYEAIRDGQLLDVIVQLFSPENSQDAT